LTKTGYLGWNPIALSDADELLTESTEIGASDVTIANGASTSSAFDGSNFSAFGAVLPAAFTGASISFTVCDTAAGTFVALFDVANVLVSVPVTQGRAYDLPSELAAFPFFKIVSASAEGAARTIRVVGKS
jgi:hypothetical protein